MSQRGLSIGELVEQIKTFTDLGGMLGSNVSEDKEVLVEIPELGISVPLRQVAVTFREGRFVMLLQGSEHVIS
jgi:hypothetical protein